MKTILFLLISISAFCQDEAFKHITKEKLKEVVNFLADDKLEGRLTGTEGEQKAADYVAKIFKDSGLKPVGDKDEAGKPTFFQKVPIEKISGRNVLGLLEGSDPTLKDEIVVISAHHDHIGRVGQLPQQQLGGAKGADDIFNGASDNASGVAVMAVIAQAFANAKLKPKRSVLFLSMTGEEMGLLGSKFYAAHPIAEPRMHVADINIDMVGVDTGRPVTVMGFVSDSTGLMKKSFEDSVANTGMEANLVDYNLVIIGDSDHSNFMDIGIPAVLMNSGLHKNYHQVTDHTDVLSFVEMEATCKTVGGVVWTLANSEKRPVFNPKSTSFPYSGLRPLYKGIEEVQTSIKELNKEFERKIKEAEEKLRPMLERAKETLKDIWEKFTDR